MKSAIRWTAMLVLCSYVVIGAHCGGGGNGIPAPDNQGVDQGSDDQGEGRPVPSAGVLQCKWATYSVTEADGLARIHVSRVDGSSGPAEVAYVTSDGTALAGSDYTTTSGTLSWADADAADKSFDIPITNDNAYEGDETFTVTLSTASGAALGSPVVATVTITNDDSVPPKGVVQFKGTNYSVTESGGTVRILVGRTDGSWGPAEVTYTTSDGTAIAGSDYTATSGTLNWADADDADKYFDVPVTNDSAYEGDETFTVKLGAAGGAALGSAISATVTITNDDSRPGAVSGQVTLVSGAPLAGVAVSLTNALSSSTDNNGFFSFSGLVAGQAIVAQFHKDGYAPTSKTLNAQAIGETIVQHVMMVPAGAPQTLAAGSDNTIHTTKSAVTIPANALVDGDGNLVTGNVSLSVTHIDPSTDNVNAFPGSFAAAVSSDGTPATLESFGFAIYELTQDGHPVNLGPGQHATIEYILPDNSQSRFVVGDHIPLWEFDEATATWTEAGFGVVQLASDGSGKLAWVAQVSHFSSWNCDWPFEPNCVTGRVLADGLPVGGALVVARGVDYNAVYQNFTSMDGIYCIDVKRGGQVRLEVHLNGAAEISATKDVTAADVNTTCARGGCTDAGDLSLALTACVRGKVKDNTGAPVPGATIHVVPGQTVTADAGGNYCAKAQADTDVYVFVAGRPGIKVHPAAGTCEAGTCVQADLDIVLPESGDMVGVLMAGQSKWIGGGFDESMYSMQGLFVIAEPEVFDDFVSGVSINEKQTREESGGCTVLTSSWSYGGGAAPEQSSPAMGALDPGSRGLASNGSASLELVRPQYNQSSLTAGMFEPSNAARPADLGFALGQTITFQFPGGTDIGGFTGSVGGVADLVITSPALADPVYILNRTQPFDLTWAAGDPLDKVQVVISSYKSTSVQNPDNTTTFTNSNITIKCAFPDTGSGTISADLLSRLFPGNWGMQITRVHESTIEVPLNRTGAKAKVKLVGKASITRQLPPPP